MNNDYFSHAVSCLCSIGIWRTSLQIIATLHSIVVDWWFNRNIWRWVGVLQLDIDGCHKKHASPYVGTTYLSFNSIMRQSGISPNGVFLDLGCGKGRAMICALQYGFKDVRGVDVSRKLIDAAENALQPWSCQDGFRVRFVDDCATSYEFADDEMVIYLFDPFDEYILCVCLENIEKSLVRAPRILWVVYRAPLYESVLDNSLYFEKTMNGSAWGWGFSVYKSVMSNSLSTNI